MFALCATAIGIRRRWLRFLPAVPAMSNNMKFLFWEIAFVSRSCLLPYISSSSRTLGTCNSWSRASLHGNVWLTVASFGYQCYSSPTHTRPRFVLLRRENIASTYFGVTPLLSRRSFVRVVKVILANNGCFSCGIFFLSPLP